MSWRVLDPWLVARSLWPLIRSLAQGFILKMYITVLRSFFTLKNFEFGSRIYIKSGHRERATSRGYSIQFVVWLPDLYQKCIPLLLRCCCLFGGTFSHGGTKGPLPNFGATKKNNDSRSRLVHFFMKHGIWRGPKMKPKQIQNGSRNAPNNS